MPFIWPLSGNFATKGKGYESDECKGFVLPEKERGGCRRELPCDGKVEHREILGVGFQHETQGAAEDVGVRPGHGQECCGKGNQQPTG